MINLIHRPFLMGVIAASLTIVCSCDVSTLDSQESADEDNQEDLGVTSDAIVVGPYTVRTFRTNADGSQGSEVTASAQLQANTEYLVRITVSTSVATFRVTGGDGFESGLFGNHPFVPRSDSPNYQQDGSSGAFPIRTLSGADFVTPLFMRVSQCSMNCANPGGSGWNSARAILFPSAN